MSRAVEAAYEKIRAGILSGEFAPGQHLKETELVRFCGVSRTPVRSALNRLAAEELIELRRNQGARVKEWPEHDVEDLFGLRILLEGHAAFLAAGRIAPRHIEIIESSIVEMERVLGENSPLEVQVEAFLRLNSRVHGAIWEASGSARLKSILGKLVEQALQVRTAATFNAERIAESHHHHCELLRALKAGDGMWAEAIMRNHIRAALESLHPGREH